ncbi:MAG: hypothetical protein Q7T55_01815 [Solirubrobacteraceae bacterium]|nr:hypothetical protein [Solirubrobacteraceae bacterium]
MTTQAPERASGQGSEVDRPLPVPPPDLPREPLGITFRYWLREQRVAVAAWLLIVVLLLAGAGLYVAGALDPFKIKTADTTFGTKGANLVERGAFGSDIDVGVVGDGQDTTFIIRDKSLSGPQPAVIFLHGFGSSLVVGYEPWLEHLARQGLTVIFPSWQQPPFPIDGTQNPRVNMFRGVRLAVQAVPIQQDKVAVMGFSAGAALAFDYAALSKKLDVPKAGLVYSVYPGRAFPGEEKVMLPLPPAGDIPADTKIVTLVSRKDREAGTAWGRAQYDSLAGRGRDLRELVYVDTPGLGGHFAPAEVGRDVRTTFWQPFDRLLTAHLGVQRLPDPALKRSIRSAHKTQELLQQKRIDKKKAQRGESSVLDGGSTTTNVIGAKPDLPNG